MRKKLNKKGQLLGFDNAIAVITILAIIGVTIVAVLLTFSSLLPAVQDTATKNSGSETNESASITASGYTLAKSSLLGFTAPTVTLVQNVSNGAYITSGNYTLTGNVLTNATTANMNSVLVTYTYTYSGNSALDAEYVTKNISSGFVKFISYAPTIMTVLAVVVIVLAISLILYAVNRFAGTKTDGGL